MDYRGAGGKSDSTARTPVESPDSLHSIAYAKIIDLISEGEIRGLANGLQSIALDGAPLQSVDGQMNFQNVVVQTRVGTQDQEHLAGFPSVENEITVGVELRSDTPIVRTVSGSELSAVRVRLAVPALQRTKTDNGDTIGYRITYAVDVSTDGGAYTTLLTDTITGKTTTQYERSRRIDLPAGAVWQIRFRRLTANANSALVADTLNILSLTEIIDAKLRYPNSALVALEIDASQFQSIPTRGYDCYWRIIGVPSNYDAETRSYTGIWDGTFKSAWSDNPAWVFYDMVTNNRFGLGGIVAPEMVDRWRLYQIGQYCDQMVSDGLGGQEPRFTCDTYLQTTQDAYKLLQDLASVFRGISYYAMGQVLASADMPMDPVYTYTAANVIDGRFTYEGSGRKTRHTVALVSWSDQSDFGRQKVEPVVYREGVARYGIQQTEVTAFGCTSRGQAQRIGNHILLSENLETETVTFAVGLDGVVAEPGQIIQVADPQRAGRRIGGRIRSASGQTVVLDLVPEGMAPGDSLIVMLPTGRSQARTIEAISDNAVTVSAPWTVEPKPQAVWATESAELALQTFKVLAVIPDEEITFKITALKHVPQKFAAIDNGAKLELPPISIIPPSVQPPPTNVTLASRSMIEQGIANHTLTISWDAAEKAIAYDVEWRRDDLDWVRAGRVSTTSLEIPGIYAGQYLARVRAVNALGAVSIPALSGLTTIEGKTTPPPTLASLTASGEIFAIKLDWTFQAGSSDTGYTEIYYGPGSDFASAQLLGQFAYPTNTHRLQGLAAGVQFFFWARLVDRSGNVGDWYPGEDEIGIVGTSSSDASAILEYLTHQITETQLAQDLLDKIDAIDDIVPLVWDPDATYEQGQSVVFGGVIYGWNSATPGNEEPPGTHWDDIGTAIVEAGAVAGQVAQLQLDVSELDGEVTAQGEKVDGLFAQLDVQAAGDTNWGAGDTAVFAGTITVQSVAANATLAQAQRTDTVQASLNTTNAAVQATSTAVATLDGRASASWVLRAAVTADGRYYAAGIALGIDYNGGVLESQFLVNADTFAILNGTGAGATITSPFIVTGGQVFINQAFIADGTITNAKIGEYIQSTNYVAATSGWRLDKNGSFERNGSNGSGRRVSDAVKDLIYDGSGVLRIAFGLGI